MDGATCARAAGAAHTPRVVSHSASHEKPPQASTGLSILILQRSAVLPRPHATMPSRGMCTSPLAACALALALLAGSAHCRTLLQVNGAD